MHVCVYVYVYVGGGTNPDAQRPAQQPAADTKGLRGATIAEGDAALQAETHMADRALAPCPAVPGNGEGAGTRDAQTCPRACVRAGIWGSS